MLLKSFQANSVCKSKPNSLSSAPSGPNSIQTKLPFFFLLSLLKSTVIRSRLEVDYSPPHPTPTTHTHTCTHIPPCPIPDETFLNPQSLGQFISIRKSGNTYTHKRQTESPICSVAFGVISLAVDRSSEGVICDNRITQVETGKKTTKERKGQKLKKSGRVQGEFCWGTGTGN